MPCTSHGDIHPPQIPEKTNVTIVITSDHGEDNDVTLLPLKTVNGVNSQQTSKRSEELISANHTSQ